MWITSSDWQNSGDARCPCYMCGYDAFESIPLRKRQCIEGKKYARDGWLEEY
jgi:hypothetical protein